MISRAWIGEEKEGKHKGVYTLFIESPDLDGKEIVSFIETISEPFERLYLGAGGIDVLNFTRADKLIEYCKDNDIQVVIETTLQNEHLLSLYIRQHAEVILTIRKPNFNLSGINAIKLENKNFLYVIDVDLSPIELTSLHTLNNGLYEGTDELIYEGEKNENISSTN